MTKESFDSKLLTLIIWFIVLGAASWIFGAITFAAWSIFGDMQARGAREHIFDALVEQDIEWFDQRKDGVGALTARLQG